MRRLETVALSSLILLAIMASNAGAIVDPSQVTVEPGQSLADQLISNSNGGGIISGDPRFAKTPQQSRDQQKNKTDLNWTMPSTLSDTATSAKSSRTEAESTGVEQDAAAPTGESTDNASAASTVSDSGPAASAGGSWYFELNDSTKKDLAIALFQKDAYVYGAGNMKEGNNTLQVAASGSFQDGRLDLNVTSLGSIGLYRLMLDVNGDSGAGEYQAFSANGDSWRGSVEGMRTAVEE